MTPRTAPAFAALVLAAACGAPGTRTAGEGHQQATRLVGEARQHLLALRLGRAINASLAALAADPHQVDAVFVLLEAEIADWSARSVLALDSVAATAARQGDSALGVCYRRIANSRRGVALPAVPPPPHTPQARLCLDVVLSEEAFPPTTRLSPARLEELLDAYPDEVRIAKAVILHLQAAEDWDGVVRAAGRLTPPGRDPLVRAFGYAAAVNAEHERGNDAAAEAVERTAARDPDSRYPAFRKELATHMAAHSGLRALVARRDTGLIRHAAEAVNRTDQVLLEIRGAGDQTARLAYTFSVATGWLDRGRIEEAVTGLAEAVAMADSVGDPLYRGFARMRLGRALVKSGRHHDAERTLLAARQVADSIAFPVVQKEVEHNLLHLYEGTGRWAEARAAGEAFVRHAAASGLNAVRMMSARDVGMFHRARGNVAASRPYFARMLADIDSLGRQLVYAAEYYELAGNLDSARLIYERAFRASDEPVRSLEGLVRVSLALGDSAGARQWATIHDARRAADGRPESAPLLPLVLARTAPLAEARRAFGAARRETAQHGQVAAWAALTADLAELELRAGGFATARRLADSAAMRGRAVSATETALRGEALTALAAMHESAAHGDGGHEGAAHEGGAHEKPTREGAPQGLAGFAALATLERVARAAEHGASTQLRADIHGAVAEALGVTGRWTEALAWYTRAAGTLDSAASLIALDPRQATYRSAQRRVYDQALTLIVRHAADPGAVDAFARWSARRKGRTFGASLPLRPVARPPRGTAILDYVLLDTVLAVLVVTADASEIVALGTPPGVVRRDISRLRAALDVRVGSRLDVTRARFPMDAAHRLHRALVMPLESRLAGVRALSVVADGPLGLVPFDALVAAPGSGDTGERDATFLIDRYTISTAATAPATPFALRAGTARITAVASPTATDGDRELEAIGHAAGAANVSLLAGTAATPAAVVHALTRAGIIHIAAHAVANEHEPEFSHIRLAREPGGSDRLTAGDIAALRLPGPLVVLSACESAGGRALDGEGVLSLSRSFLRAGARATIATLWPVGPQAVDFTAELYARLSSGRDVASAVRDAKLSLRKAGAPAFAWAPYQLFLGSPAATAPDLLTAGAR